jgi:hypothetical protein
MDHHADIAAPRGAGVARPGLPIDLRKAGPAPRRADLYRTESRKKAAAPSRPRRLKLDEATRTALGAALRAPQVMGGPMVFVEDDA